MSVTVPEPAAVARLTDCGACGPALTPTDVPAEHMEHLERDDSATGLRRARRPTLAAAAVDVIVHQRSQKLRVGCDWSFRVPTKDEQIARRKRGINQAIHPGFVAVLRKDEHALQYLMHQEPQLRGFVGETTLHNAFLLADAINGWDVCKRLVDAFPQQVADEYICDAHEDIDDMTTQINKEWVNTTPDGARGDDSRGVFLLEQLSCTGTTVDRDDVLPGLYTGENVLHIAIVQQNVDMVKFLLCHPAVRAQQKRKLLCARAHGTFFMPEVVPCVTRFARQSLGSSKTLTTEYNDVRMGDNDESRCYMGEYPYSFACCRGSTEIMDILWEAAISLKVTNKHVCSKDGVRSELETCRRLDPPQPQKVAGKGWDVLRHAVLVEWEETLRVHGKDLKQECCPDPNTLITCDDSDLATPANELSAASRQRFRRGDCPACRKLIDTAGSKAVGVKSILKRGIPRMSKSRSDKITPRRDAEILDVDYLRPEQRLNLGSG